MTAKPSVFAFHTLRPRVAECVGEDRRRGVADPHVDFQDGESQRVLAAAATALAPELGRQAARELWAELTRTRK